MPNDERSDEETKRISDAVLRRMLSTPPGKKKRKARKKPKRAARKKAKRAK